MPRGEPPPNPNVIDFKFGGRKKEVWKTIREGLEKATLKTPEALRDTLVLLAEVAGSLKKADQFEQIPALLQQVSEIDPKLHEKFYTNILPKIQEWARQFPTHFPDPVPILRAGKSGKVTLTEKQCVYLLAGAFFCILPEPLTDAIQSLNFRKFFRANDHKQAQKLCAVLRYFEHHISQLKPSFEREEDEELEAFKERQKEFRQNVYAKWGSRSLTLIRGQHEDAEGGGGGGKSASQSPGKRRRSFVEPHVGVDMSFWSATECSLDKCELVLEESGDALAPRTSEELVRVMELQSSRYGGDFLGQSYDAVEAFFASHVQAMAFLPFIEKADLSKEWLSVRSARKTCEMGEDFRCIPREEGYSDGRTAADPAFSEGPLGESPCEVVSCAFSSKKTTPETLDAIRIALKPRSFVPEVKEKEEPDEEEDTDNPAPAVEAAPKEPVDAFFPEKTKRVVVLPYSFLTHLGGTNIDNQMAWVLLWWIVCAQVGVQELRVSTAKCQLDAGKMIKGPMSGEAKGMEGRQSVTESLESIVELVRTKNIRAGLLYALLHEYRVTSTNLKNRREPLSAWIQTTLLFGN
ncbi:unnamed protein product [Amoebophrya sp. A120]|nr:unnamed protein product [Amoebophrya sp. A120]|eukprot:GSA120T00007283001.1